MADAVRERIQRHLAILERRLAERRSSAMPRLHFRIITNADFSNEILAPVLEQDDAIADTNELFLRAQQLMRFSGSSPRNGLSGTTIDRPATAGRMKGAVSGSTSGPPWRRSPHRAD